MAVYKTPFSKRCEILGELWLYYREDAAKNDVWSQFFTVYDIGLPLAYMHWQDLATVISADGEASVSAAWDSFCRIIDIDIEDDYDSLGDCFDSSPNEPLEDN